MSQSTLTSFSPEISDKSKIYDALLMSGFLLALCWIPFLMEEFLDFQLRKYGMFPRTLEGLRGIVTMHFLHSDWKHIGQNSLGILVLNSFLFYFYRSISFRVFAIIFFLSPILLWVVGRQNNHIGASVILYGEFAFLFISGMIRKNPILMRVALVVILYYGSLVWYLFPIDQRISWEGHACGFFAGLLAAFIYKNKGPERKKYKFETEPELPDDENAYWKIPENPEAERKHETTVTVRYHYKEDDKESGHK